ncbi:MAG: hypothetical protein ACLSH5_01275 [Christensenellales bacterium]
MSRKNYLVLDEYRCHGPARCPCENLTELWTCCSTAPHHRPHNLLASVHCASSGGKEIYVSTGSACSAHKKGRNRILNAMGVIGDRQEGAIRFSFCPFNTIEEMDVVAEEISTIIAMLRRFKRR